VSFNPTSGGAAHGVVPITHSEYITANVAAVEDLVVGTYDITVQAWGGFNYGTADANPIATGTKSVVITAGNNTATITLGPITQGVASGAFAYAITVPVGVESGSLTITTAPGGNVVSGGEVTLGVGANSNSGTPLSLAPGYYQARVILTKDGRSAGLVEMVHIYTKGTTTLTKTFTDADFATEGPPPSGDMGLIIQGTAFSNVNGEGDLLGTGPERNGLLIARGSSRKASITLNAPSDFTDCAWYVDGGNAGTGSSLTLNAASYTSGAHTLSFIGWKGGIAQSQILSLYVAASDAGWVYPDELAAHLADLPAGTAEAPTLVTLARTAFFVDVWEKTIYPAIQALTKYIKVDLSACVDIGFGVTFYYIQSPYVAGIVLPSFVTEIAGSAFSGWTGLRDITFPEGVTKLGNTAFRNTGFTSIVIPATITSIGNRCFYQCSKLVSVTFEGNGVSSLDTEQFPGNLHTVYNAVTQKAGTYVSADNGATWTKQ
jgi:hypothetical protein